MTDLSDYGGGVEFDDPDDPEDRDNLYLSQWLAGPRVDVYWDRNKSYGFGTFTTGISFTPDLVADAQENTFAIETKQANTAGKVIDGAEQVEGYWRDIESGKAEYELDGEPTEIDAVVLATRASPDGHLIENTRGRDPRRPSRSRGGSDVAGYGHLPGVEHSASEAIVRMMHRFARRWYNNSDKDSTDTGIGALYSSSLDGGHDGLEAVPAVFHLSPGNGNQSHAWEYLPFYKHPRYD
jgi:hypothetical protein